MRVDNSWFALVGVFTLKDWKQIWAATSDRHLYSLLSAKIPKSLPFFFLKFFTISNCRWFSECYEKLWGREGRCNLLSYIKTSLFSDQKISSILFLKIYSCPAFIPTFLIPVVFQLPSIPCSVPVSQVEFRLATFHPVLRWLNSLVWVSASARQLDAFRARCILSNTVFYIPVVVMSQLGKLTWGSGDSLSHEVITSGQQLSKVRLHLVKFVFRIPKLWTEVAVGGFNDLIWL